MGVVLTAVATGVFPRGFYPTANVYGEGISAFGIVPQTIPSLAKKPSVTGFHIGARLSIRT